MNNEIYLYAAYIAFWLLPLWFILKTYRKVVTLENKLNKIG